jgi:hypothetical protein
MASKHTEGGDAGTADERAAAIADRRAQRAEDRDSSHERRDADEPADIAVVPDTHARRDADDSRAAPPLAEDRTGARPVVTDEDIRTMTGGEDLGIYRAHRRFGGFDPGAAISGALAAVGMTALVGGLAGGLGTVGYQLDVERDTQTLSTGGFIAGLAVLVLSFLVGGWVAGRVGRYDGGKNGLGAAVIFVVLSAVVAGLGAWFGDQYNVFANLELPQWFTTQANSATGILSAVVALIVVLGAGWLGGKAGEHYHRKADAYLAEYAEGNARGDVARTLGMPKASGRRARLLNH